jgi:ring-1,2-phenylacetyl-CoA epoxidase subunit PaaC
VLYEQVAALDGTTADRLAFGRGPEAFHNAILLEQPNGDWAFTVVRAWLYDQADAVRLAALATSRLGEPAVLARTLQREEKYHLLFSDAWLVRLARSGPDGHARVQAAVTAAWPDAVGLFEPPPGVEPLVEAGLLQAPAEQGAQWERTARARLSELGLEVPSAAPRTGGRVGRHSPDLSVLLDEMTSVWRTDPAARW